MTISRREFLASTVAGTTGLMISFYVPNGLRAAPMTASPLPSPNAFLRIGNDEAVTVLLAHSEMGQGIWTGLAMLIAEELDCDWSKIRCEHAPAAPVYAHPFMGFQMTAGSTSTLSEFDRYRSVGATAKVLLLRAAATRWKTTPAMLTATRGIITFGDQRLTYGEVAEAAMKLPLPQTVTLKEPQDWQVIGTEADHRGRQGRRKQLPRLSRAANARDADDRCSRGPQRRKDGWHRRTGDRARCACRRERGVCAHQATAARAAAAPRIGSLDHAYRHDDRSRRVHSIETGFGRSKRFEKDRDR